MNEWFSPEVARLFSFFSVLSLLACVAPWVAKGKFKSLVTSLFLGGLGLGILFLGGSVIALIGEQPPYVVWTLTLTGVVITGVFAITFGVVRSGYAQAEHRRMLAKDI